jgi:hypothetical protein
MTLEGYLLSLLVLSLLCPSSGMHVQQQELMANGSATLMLEFELWVSRSNGASGTIEVGGGVRVGVSSRGIDGLPKLNLSL